MICNSFENCILSMFLWEFSINSFKESMPLMWTVNNCPVNLYFCILGFLKARHSYISIKIVSSVLWFNFSRNWERFFFPFLFLFLLSLYFPKAWVPFWETRVWDIMLHCKIKNYSQMVPWDLYCSYACWVQTELLDVSCVQGFYFSNTFLMCCIDFHLVSLHYNRNLPL